MGVFTRDGVDPEGSPSGRMQFVDATSGNDNRDGTSWGDAKESIADAVAALPNGGRILVASSATEYEIESTLTLAGHNIEGIARAPGGTNGLVLLRHRFNGNLIDFGDDGGQLRNLFLYEDDDTTGRTGAAIAATSSASNGGTILCENLVISGGDGWQRDLVLDGSAWATFGIRKFEAVNCQFFGCRTAGETIKITRGVHCHFVNGFVDEAPTVVTQGVKLLDTGTTAVYFSNFRIIGNLITEAAGDVVFEGGITGNVTCQASSDNNVFIGRIGGTFTNNGLYGNCHVGPQGIDVGNEVKIRRGSSQNALTVTRNGSPLLNITSDGVINVADGVGGAYDAYISRGGAADVMTVGKSLKFVAMAAAGVPNNTVFIDSADNTLKFKDSGGTLRSLY